MNALRYHAYEGMGICFVQSLASCKALATKRHECASSAALTVGRSDSSGQLRRHTNVIQVDAAPRA